MTTLTSVTTAHKRRTITLTDRAPVTISDDVWPTIATATWHDGQHERDAARSGWLKVRRHADGRTLVYGGYDTRWQGEADLRGGELLAASVGDTALVEAIRRVADTVHAHRAVAACIADLPAEEI